MTDCFAKGNNWRIHEGKQPRQCCWRGRTSHSETDKRLLLSLSFILWAEERDNRKCVCTASYNHGQIPLGHLLLSVQSTFFGLQLPPPSPLLIIGLNLVHFESSTLFSYFIFLKQHCTWGSKESGIRDDKNLAMFVAFNQLTALNMRTILFSKTVSLSQAKELWMFEAEIRNEQLKWRIQEFEFRWATLWK